jgi:hypothetical protein
MTDIFIKQIIFWLTGLEVAFQGCWGTLASLEI